MNKNKLSRFLLSTSVGMITALGLSEVSANALEVAAQNNAIAAQTAEIKLHREAGIKFFQTQDNTITDTKARALVNTLVLDPSGLSALNTLGEQTTQLFSHFKDILLGGIELTPEHFDSFLSQIADASTLRALGVDSIRELKSPEAERLVAPAQVTNVKDALYFAEQRKGAGEFESSAEFFLKARDLTEATNTTVRTDFSEKALLMYSEHFIHHVARVSSVTEENVTAAQTLLASVKALAESTNTTKAILRAASCAEELGTAIYDLILKQIAARDKLTDTAAKDAADVKIAKIYVTLYNADIVARDMHEKAAAKSSGQDKNSELVAAAESMRLAIGALADAHARSATAVFSGDVTVATKLYDEAVAFKTMHTDLASTSGVVASEGLKTSAATSQILLSKLKATWNARSRFATATANRDALNSQYTGLETSINNELDTANTRFSAIDTTEKYLSAREIATVRSVNAEKLYRAVLDKAAASPIVEGDVTPAVTALREYVITGTNSVLSVVEDLDKALKATLDEVKAANIRSARTDCNRTLSKGYALIAKAFATELEKVTTASPANRRDWLVDYLNYARKADNKAAWEAGVKAVDVVLADAQISTPAADDARLVKALALTAKAEALLKRNTDADDATVATVDANKALSAGLLFDANAAASAILDASRDKRVKARDHLRKAFESAVDLHNSAAVKQGLRTVWASVENAYAVDKLTIADAELSAAIATNSSLHQQNGETWAAILGCFTAGDNAEAVKDAIRTALFGTDDAGAGDGTIHGANDTLVNRRAALVANTLAKFFDDKDTVIGASNATPADHAWYTVEGLFNDLKKEYDRILGLSTVPYVGYKEAAAAFEKARKAKADWAKVEADGLSAVAAATWAAKRDAAGAAYVAAADYETKRTGALLAASGIGKFADLATLDDINSELTVLLATAYVTEDVLTSLHRRAVSLKEAAKTYNTTRAAAGTDVAIDANTAFRDTAIESAVEDSTGAEADGTGAYEFALGLVNKAYQGLAGFNSVAGFGALVGERLTAVTTAYRKVNAAWLSDLTATLDLATTGTDAATHKTALAEFLLTNAAVSDGGNSALMAGRIFSVGALFEGNPYPATHSVYRDIALGYETVLRTLVTLGTTTEDHQKHVYTALKTNAEAAKDIPLKEYTPAASVSTQQMNDVITQLTQRADLAEAVVAAAYGALRSNTPSNTTKSYRAARAEAISEMTSLIQEGAREFADVVLTEESSVSTADLKAKTAHELGRLFMAKAAAERIRFDNSGVTTVIDLARSYYLNAIEAFKKERDAILSQSDSSLMENRNTRLVAVYEHLAEAYKNAVQYGANALLKDQYTATFNQAEILYREGQRDRSAEILEKLTSTSGAAVIHGTILKELAEQYEAEGKFVQAANVYKASTEKHVAQKEVAAAYEAAENALKAAEQSGQPEACVAAAEAFNLIGSKEEFHGRVRAEAHQKAAAAYILGEMYASAGKAYNLSAAEWAKIGDHMQAGNQYEKAAWALSKIATVTVDQRIEIIQAIEKAAHQLQISGAAARIEKLVNLAEEQIKVIQDGEDSLTTGKLKIAVVAAAGAMYEKALAFQKEGDLSHAEASEARISALLRVVDTEAKEANILVHLAKLYSLQKKHALAVDRYIDAAVEFVKGNKLLEAANAYANAADAVLAAGEGNRIRDEILPALLDISASVRTGGSKSGRSDQFDIHLAVIQVYRDLAKLNPSAIDTALAEVEAIEKEVPTQKETKARVANVKIGLLAEKVTTVASDAAKAALLQQAQAAFDGVKALTGETTIDTINVKRTIAMAANSLAKVYELSRVIHTATGLVHLKALRAVIEVAEAASIAAYDAASKAKRSYDVALEASKEAARTMESYTKAMVHYVASEKDKARTDDMDYLRAMPDRMAKIVESSVRATLLGVLKSLEEEAVIRSNFVEVFDAFNKVSTYVVGLRNSEAARDSFGDADKATQLKATLDTTSTAIKGAVTDLKDKATAAQDLPPVARSEATDKIVSEKTDQIASVVLTGVKTQAALVTEAPAASVTGEQLANLAQDLVKTVIGDGKATGGNTSGIVGDLRSAQSGPSTSANAVISKRS